MMIHHFLQLGFDLDKLINLTTTEKSFYIASMITKMEEDKRNKTF